MSQDSAREPFVGCVFSVTVLPKGSHIEMQDPNGKVMAEGLLDGGLEGLLLHAMIHFSKL